ncbi:hypothetical protein LCGC14_3156790 [marine sediment metagenome]|uniref:Uncharacterized protein n=1 Tax=marine sediment metagenome TaxID=412755 RepID=A0A0F8YGW4_9ZZZZ
MAAITATFWTITRQNMYIAGPRKRLLVKAVLAAGTCPAAGAPGPTVSNLGFVKYLTNIVIVDHDDSNFINWKYDQANNKFRPQGFLLLGAAVKTATIGGGRAMQIATGRDAIGTTGAVATISGAAAQLPTTVTVAEQTLYLEAAGW